VKPISSLSIFSEGDFGHQQKKLGQISYALQAPESPLKIKGIQNIIPLGYKIFE
jgi:hypothetical protein